MHARSAVLCLGLLAACSPVGGPSKLPPPVSPQNHPWFPLTAGTTHEYGKVVAVDGALGCESCHANAETFTEFQCISCHKHPTALTDRLHLGVTDFAPTSAGCYQCHPAGEKQAFSHTGITPGTAGANCAQCHQETNAFASLPKPGFTHPGMGGSDCGSCHESVTDWKQVSDAPNGKWDPAAEVAVTGLIPSFTGLRLTRVTPLAQQLPMPMFHNASALDAGVVAQCSLCHLDSAAGVYFPGLMHSSLQNEGIEQPARCAECHATSHPEGFVGPLPTAPARTPASGEMRHEAVAWDGGAPTTARLVSNDCEVCHANPSRVSSSWAIALPDGGRPTLHASLTAKGLAQPGSCLDCHANSRPVALLTSATAALPAGVTFDHDVPSTLGDCTSCHQGTSVWSGAKYHLPGAAAPGTCLPCHAQERPTSTTGWQSTTYTRSPFDYGTNAQGVTHGGGEDCAVCHGTSTQTWVGGHFPHGAGTLATSTCIACHVTQRPAAVVMSFDHALNGTGDCRACHQATVTAGRYVDYVNPSTMMLPGGDWQGGRAYPGDVVVTSATQFVALTQYTLQRATPGGLVTGITTQTGNFYDSMLHTSAAIPAQVFPGPANAPDSASCWHCHTNVDGGVTSFADGKYHEALTSYSAAPGGTVTPLPQPTTRCLDCHEAMRPDRIVQKSASVLQPMDHSATFTTSVMLGGQPTTTVNTVECSVCHGSPGNTWSDGRFHANIGAAVPADCTTCHYPLMATAQADVTSTTVYLMKHRSPQLTFQKCDTCHTSALSRGANMPIAATLWRTGELHAKVSPQPASCLECHSNSEPAAATQGTELYTFMQGGTATNGASWMNHTLSAVTSRDCAACHRADAKPTGSAWSQSTAFHAVVTTNPGACTSCHGTGNGRGTVQGTNNNLPSGLTSSRTTTTASNAPGVKDQITHADLNVSSRDCGVCHTQAGPSTTSGIQGVEWKQARFHQNFTTANPLVMNGTTGRCSTCHLNVKPGPTFTAFDHSAYTAAPGTPDCVTCHVYPGTSTTTPNWLGAAAVPAFISVGGFTISQPPATAANTVQTGIANLPHPAVGSGVACTTCHTQAAGGRRAFGYDHLSSLINTKCSACHESGSDLVGTVWNGATTEAAGAGDTRPFTLPSVRATYKGNTTTETYPKHFWPIDCAQCHIIPPGNGLVTTGAAYQTAWKFPHTTNKMTNPSTCLTCHPGGAPR